MKRNENIAPLSRDHHSGLLFCWKIKQGLDKKTDAARIIPYINYYWVQHLKKHFIEEEQILFVHSNDALCTKAMEDHRQIEQLIGSILKDALSGEDKLLQLANMVNDHIRFEERQLFPKLESMLSQDELLSIGQQLNELHLAENKDLYTDEFWLK